MDVGQFEGDNQHDPCDTQYQLPGEDDSRNRTARTRSRSPCPATSSPTIRYTADVATTANTNPAVNTSIAQEVVEPSASTLSLSNLSRGVVANTSIKGIPALQSLDLLKGQQAEADLAVAKSLAPGVDVAQARIVGSAAQAADFAARLYQPICGFSVYNPGTGEAYIVEVVNADLGVPDQLPDPSRTSLTTPITSVWSSSTP